MEETKSAPAKKTAHSIDELNEMQSEKKSNSIEEFNYLKDAIKDKSMPVSGVAFGPGQPDGTNMSFGSALYYLDKGMLLQRKGWNGKGMFIYKTIGNIVSKDFIPKFASLPAPVKDYLAYRGEDVVFNASLTMLTATGEMQPGWLASQTDMLANDWQIVSPIK